MLLYYSVLKDSMWYFALLKNMVKYYIFDKIVTHIHYNITVQESEYCV